MKPLRFVNPLLALLLAASAAGRAPAQSPTLADFWVGRASFAVDTSQSFGAGFGMHFLSTRWEGNQLYAYYIKNFTLNGVGRSATGLAVSRDGVTFTDRGQVLGIGPNDFDQRLASFPGVWKDGGTWYLVYEAAGTSGRWPGDIGLATSSDGVRWQKEAAPILVHQNRGWERANIGTPSLWKEGTTWYLFYHGYDGQDVQIGVATGTNLRNLTRYSGNPILPTSAAGPDAGTLGKRSIRRERDGLYYMVHEISTDQPFERARWSSNVARSRDLLRWEKWPGGRVLPQTASGFGFDGPEWVQTPDGKLHIYFRDPSGPTRRATLKSNTRVAAVPVRAAPGQLVALRAKVVSDLDNEPRPGKAVRFVAGTTPLGVAVTGADGIATLPVKLPANLAPASVLTALFDGDDGENGSFGQHVLLRAGAASPPSLAVPAFRPKR